MSTVRLVLTSLFVVALAGCSSPSEDATGDTGESSDTEIRVGAKKSVSGLKFGSYANASAKDGEFASLELESRTSRSPRNFDGLYSGKRKVGGVVKSVKGGFQVVSKDVPSNSRPGTTYKATVLRLFDEKGGTLHESVFSYLQNTLVLFNWKTNSSQLLDVMKDANGKAPFSLSCTLKKLYDSNVFEEGLSLDEYPDISVEDVDGKLDVGIGASSFDQADPDGERIEVVSRSATDIDLKILFDGGSGGYRFTVKDKKGVISEIDGSATKKVADFTCR